MTINRRSFLTVSALGMVACAPDDKPADGPATPEPKESSMTPAETTSSTPAAPGELASPDPDVLFPAGSGLVVTETGVAAPSLTHLVSWGSDGSILSAQPLRDVAMDDMPGTGDPAWALRNGTFVVAGGERYSWAAASFDPWEPTGSATVERTDTPPADSTAPRTKYAQPRSVATDGQHVAATFSDGAVKVFEATGKLLREFRPEGLAPSDDVIEIGVRYLPGDLLLVWGRDAPCPVQLWKSDGSASVTVMPDGPTQPVHVEPSTTEQHLLVTAYDRDSSTMPFWIVTAESLEVELDGQLPAAATAVALSPDGQTIASAGSVDGGDALPIHLMDADSGETRSVSREGYVARSMTFSLDGATLYTHNAKAGIVEWDVAAGTETRQFDLP